MKKCLYCHNVSDDDGEICEKCGMALPKEDLTDRLRLQKPFLWMFVGVVVFCFFMMLYLPR